MTGEGETLEREDLGLSDAVRASLLDAQRNEITEYHVYRRLAEASKDTHNRDTLLRIAEDEHRHYAFWREYIGHDVSPDMAKIRRYVLLARTLGLTFSIKLMERGEERAQVAYDGLAESLPVARDIVQEEAAHERELIAMIDEERLHYVGSVVLGLNDALVELTGTLAGLTLALQNTQLIAMTGLITGIAASLSMAASEYLSTRTEHDRADGAQGLRDPGKAALYTGIAYVATVLFLIAPYLIFSSYLVALALTLFNAVLVIVVFTGYVSIAQDISFKRRTLEMVAISFGVAALSFLIGYLVRTFLGIDV